VVEIQQCAGAAVVRCYVVKWARGNGYNGVVSVIRTNKIQTKLRARGAGGNQARHRNMRLFSMRVLRYETRGGAQHETRWHRCCVVWGGGVVGWRCLPAGVLNGRKPEEVPQRHSGEGYVRENGVSKSASASAAQEGTIRSKNARNRRHRQCARVQPIGVEGSVAGMSGKFRRR